MTDALDDEWPNPLKEEEFTSALEVLNHVVFGRNPTTGRNMSPPRKRDRAEELADVIAFEVVEPIRATLDTLSETISNALSELDSVEATADELHEAENGDEREDAYSELDENLNAVRNALSELGIDVADTRKPKGGKTKADANVTA